MLLNTIIILALLATIASLGCGLLSMAIGGSTDKEFCERFMWIRIFVQGAAVILIIMALYLTNTQ